MSRVLGIIPARFESSRFPGKSLAKIGDKPMVQWVFEAAKACPELEELFVATDDDRILDTVHSFGGKAVKTGKHHATGTDRIVEVAKNNPEYDIVVNIQGDEPGIDPNLIGGAVRLKREHPEWEIVTAARPFQKDEDPRNPDRVKVVLSGSHRALYFSRSLVPFPRNNTTYYPVHLHLGLYVYAREFLLGFPDLPPSELEKTESLEQLRALENDVQIGVFIVPDSLPGVDTPEDLRQIIQTFKKKAMID